MLIFRGVVAGVKHEMKQGQNGDYQVVTLGIRFQKSGGYEGEEIFQDISFSREQVAASAFAPFEQLKGKLVEVEVRASANEYKGKAYLRYYYNGNYQEVTQKKAA